MLAAVASAELPGASAAARAAIGDLLDADRIRSFDVYRARVLGLPDASAAASPAR